jgi:cellobiose phosphorylase
MVGCVEGILGLRPDLGGLKLSPAIPKEWDAFSMTKIFRGKELLITVENPNHKETGFTRLILNGQELDQAYIPEELLQDTNQITLTL